MKIKPNKFKSICRRCHKPLIIGEVCSNCGSVHVVYSEEK